MDERDSKLIGFSVVLFIVFLFALKTIFASNFIKEYRVLIINNNSGDILSDIKLKINNQEFLQIANLQPNSSKQEKFEFKLNSNDIELTFKAPPSYDLSFPIPLSLTPTEPKCIELGVNERLMVAASDTGKCKEFLDANPKFF